MRTKMMTRSRYTSWGQNGTPGWGSDRSGPYCVGNPGRSSYTPSLTDCIRRVMSVGLRDALDPHEGHVEDHEQGAHEGQDEHVEPVHADDVEPGRVELAEEHEGLELPQPQGRDGLRHVDADRGGAAGQVGRRGRVARGSEEQRHEEEDDPEDPVQLPGLLV